MISSGSRNRDCSRRRFRQGQEASLKAGEKEPQTATSKWDVIKKTLRTSVGVLSEAENTFAEAVEQVLPRTLHREQKRDVAAAAAAAAATVTTTTTTSNTTTTPPPIDLPPLPSNIRDGGPCAILYHYLIIL